MGVCFQSIVGDGPVAVIMNNYTFENGYIWVVGRRQDHAGKEPDWHIQGVATDEIIAVQMCADKDYFVGPIPLNTSLPHSRIEWVGSYFPLKKE